MHSSHRSWQTTHLSLKRDLWVLGTQGLDALLYLFFVLYNFIRCSYLGEWGQEGAEIAQGQILCFRMASVH